MYIITKSFPIDEKFGLISQLRIAIVSIPSNIAEGAARSSNKDFKRFLRISLGSCCEIETQLLISFDLGFLEKEELEKLNKNASKNY
ncbi:MAG: four helix bundle protein [Polaribacter sp.]|uniref:four helix bundle protein n=1 Tax=Polaribacter sp. TaxID=1920175 RepID=UPI003EF7DEB3